MAELKDVTVWANALIRLHLDPAVWSFGFDHAKRRAGLCNFTDRRITVSRYLAARFSDDEIHQVLLHEVAHAMAGPAAGHGPVWQRIADGIGYAGGRLHDGGVAEELAPWRGTCPAGHEHFRFRRPTRMHSCARCNRGFSTAHLITWQHRDEASRA
ncbi:SprT-like domain-containing protein [Leucobacter sp. M11]|uniref:SprT-like domain-containing protein n=1 Tax=Leucobacter sp. M11 TaxID=2993565 RepID=UPI002D809FA2|nr:SprT-like domain-containing protein [Leucobacter sp. M11]MEB4614350.1 SprT-like domain-containing protein [Leucobacter sp. M11]